MNKDISIDEFFMGINFMMAAASKEARSALVVCSNVFVTSFPEHPVAKLSPLKNCLANSKHLDSSNSSLYLTYFPSEIDVDDMVVFGIKKLIYFSKEAPLPTVLNKLYAANINITVFSGNLNWLRDHQLDLIKIGAFS